MSKAVRGERCGGLTCNCVLLSANTIPTTPQLAIQVGQLKLGNGGVVYCKLDFEQGRRLISDFELMFGTELE